MAGDPAYIPALVRAIRRHNEALVGHTATAESLGNGIRVKCACGQLYTVDGWRDHIYKVCVDTPVTA